MKDIEVTIRDAENICDDAKVKQGYVPDDHVAMALVRAVNGACSQLGIEPPGPLFAQASSDEVATLRASIGELTEQSAMITQALADAGFPGRVSTGSMLTAIADMRHQALIARALGSGFSEALAEARDAYDVAALAGRDLNAHESAGIPKTPEPGQVRLFIEAANALGHLLSEMRRIDPRPVTGETITIAQPVEIGTPATAPEVTP